MSSRGGGGGGGSRTRKQRWCTPQTLTPLMEGPDPDVQDEGNKKESSWEVIREWFRSQKGSNLSISLYNNNNNNNHVVAKRQDLRLLLGVLGCPLAPIPLSTLTIHHIHIKDIPIVSPSLYF